MKKIILIHIEPVETRYTAEWRRHIPELLSKNLTDCEIVNIDGLSEIPSATTKGAFLNFGGTNIWKSNQMEQVSRLFTMGEIKDGDHIVFTDAWNPGIIQCKYMKDLLGIDVKLHGMWHAGSYDPQDFLGRLIKDKRFSYNFERSLFYALDYNHFATSFHIDLFVNTLFKGVDLLSVSNKIVKTGWPMEYMESTLKESLSGDEIKEDIVLFPHRVAPEKQPDLFRLLSKHLPEYKFIVCQDYNLTKKEYHRLLAKAKVVLSLNLQETLGISCYEGVLLDAIPLVPNRLSYSEMYLPDYFYLSELSTPDSVDVVELAKVVKRVVDNYSSYKEKLPDLKRKLVNFFSAREMLRVLKES